MTQNDPVVERLRNALDEWLATTSKEPPVSSTALINELAREIAAKRREMFGE